MQQKRLHRITAELEAAAYLHERRVAILRLLTEPATLSQVAAELGVHPANLSHHFERLKKGGLIQLVEERDTGRVIEKYYQSIARRFEVHPGGISRGARRALSTLHGALGIAMDSIKKNEQEVICFLRQNRLTDSQRKEFFQRLKGLVEEFEERSEPSSSQEGEKQNEGRLFEINASIYPAD
ncbi:MAG: helix-turn-helix domain-containing protein [Leptospiraceae bacterium]